MREHLPARNNGSKIHRNDAHASGNLHADCSLIVSGERAVCGDSFAEWSLGNSHSFDLTRRSVIAAAPAERGLIVTFARG